MIRHVPGFRVLEREKRALKDSIKKAVVIGYIQKKSLN